eukprot:ANDGO_01705.mRNA.1 hypothetical protein
MKRSREDADMDSPEESDSVDCSEHSSIPPPLLRTEEGEFVREVPAIGVVESAEDARNAVNQFMVYLLEVTRARISRHEVEHWAVKSSVAESVRMVYNLVFDYAHLAQGCDSGSFMDALALKLLDDFMPSIIVTYFRIPDLAELAPGSTRLDLLLVAYYRFLPCYRFLNRSFAHVNRFTKARIYFPPVSVIMRGAFARVHMQREPVWLWAEILDLLRLFSGSSSLSDTIQSVPGGPRRSWKDLGSVVGLVSALLCVSGTLECTDTSFAALEKFSETFIHEHSGGTEFPRGVPSLANIIPVLERCAPCSPQIRSPFKKT